MKKRSETRIRSLDEASAWSLTVLEDHPERDEEAAFEAALRGEKRRYPTFALNHLIDPSDTGKAEDDFTLPVVNIRDAGEAALAREVVDTMRPLAMENPVSSRLGLGVGPGTLVPSFGIPLDPACGNAPSLSISLEDALSRPLPDPARSGMMSLMHERVDLIRQRLPAAFRIALPDMQGPFNLAHSILGNDAFLAPIEAPERFAEFMARIVDFWIQARRNLVNWIGMERLTSRDREMCSISECSVNLISTATYEEHVLPHDLKIAAAFGRLHVHPCSGPHVFHVTLKNLPGVVGVEAGYIERTAAGAISVKEALATIRHRPILLQIGQELPEGKEFEFVAEDFDRYAEHPRMVFGYTGMHWRKKDRPRIRELHRRLDDYWRERYAG
jgi:hypothetical protein